MSIFDNILQHGALFTKENPYPQKTTTVTDIVTHAPNRLIPNYHGQPNYIKMLFTRIAIDASKSKFQHIMRDGNGAQTAIEESDLHFLFDIEANIDQTPTDFIHDLVYSLFDEGVVAVVPTFTIEGREQTLIEELRVGKITRWYPNKVEVRLYNKITGSFSEVIVEKRKIAIIENPLDELVGRDNVTLRRLMDKLAMLDAQDKDMVSSKFNMILQLPYPIRGDQRKDIAKKRIDDIHKQLKESDYGIAYTGSEEKITQLNRPLNKGLMDEIKYLTEQLLSLLGISQKVLDGTASTAEMMNYYARVVEPIVGRIREEFQRKFLTRDQYKRGHRINVYLDPFDLVPAGELAGILDTLLRNSVISPNEARSKIGFGPSDNPLADELYNRNIADTNQGTSQAGISVGADVQ